MRKSDAFFLFLACFAPQGEKHKEARALLYKYLFK